MKKTLVGALALGPRLGKYAVVKTADSGVTKKLSRAIPGHSLTLASLGVFILWLGCGLVLLPLTQDAPLPPSGGARGGL